jgi:putative oxidoreductase
MERVLGRFGPQLYAIMRIVAGLLFACHGAQKLFGAFGGQVMTSNPLLFAAALIEFTGGLLVAVGLLASWAAFVASGEMAVGYFIVHAPRGFWPIVNEGELAVVYCFAFLFIATRGAGPYSVDALRAHRA